MEGSTKPVIAAINGTAFGGGLEVALCCDYRVAASSAPLGCQKLIGIASWRRGTQRLPRLIGAPKALPMIISGDPVDASTALTLGLVDEVTDGAVVEAAIAFAEDLLAKGNPTGR